MVDTSPADDLPRFLGVGNAWDFTPPLPPTWARRMRTATASHPNGAQLEVAWTLLGGIAERTRWQGTDGQVVDFEAIVPEAREQVLLALLSNPACTGEQARAIVGDCVHKFWSENPYKFTVRDDFLDDVPDEVLSQVEARIDDHRRLRQRWARLRGWHAPTGQ